MPPPRLDDIRSEFAPQARDEDLQRIGVALDVLIVDVLRQLALRYDATSLYSSGVTGIAVLPTETVCNRVSTWSAPFTRSGEAWPTARRVMALIRASSSSMRKGLAR